MEENTNYFIVPYEILNRKQYQQHMLPIFCFLQNCRGGDYKVTTSIKTLLYICGYSTNNRSTLSNKSRIIKDTLLQLKNEGYIYKFYDENRYCEINYEDLDSISPSGYFTVEMNENISDSTHKSFAMISIYDYARFYEAFAGKSCGVALLKSFNVFMYIYSRMWKRPGFTKENRTDMDSEIIKASPEFLYVKLDRISECLGDGFSVQTIGKIIKLLDESDIIHHDSLYLTNKNNKKAPPTNVGTIFVRHSNRWKFEMMCAKDSKLKEIRKYHAEQKKGGPSDD